MFNKIKTILTKLAEGEKLLIVGSLIALIAANTNALSSVYVVASTKLHFGVNDVLLAIFFGRVAKEIREAMLPGGALSSGKTASLPLLATCGGVLGPAALYWVGVWIFNEPHLARGWAIPTATDIAFSSVVARIILGEKHPAISFLLLLAIVDDGIGLGILAAFYQSDGDNFLAGGLALIMLAISIGLFMKNRGVHSFWAYLAVPGSLSWAGFYVGGIHPALALVPIIWCMPHEHKDRGLFAKEEEGAKDTLNQFATWWKYPTEVILFLFGFTSAGVVFSTVDTGTFLVAAGLIVGKPIGITLFTLIGLGFGLRLPDKMSKKDVVVLGSIAGIGFTVALFVSGVAFPEPGAVQDSMKLGALASFLSTVVAFGLARLLQVGRFARPSA